MGVTPAVRAQQTAEVPGPVQFCEGQRTLCKGEQQGEVPGEEPKLGDLSKPLSIRRALPWPARGRKGHNGRAAQRASCSTPGLPRGAGARPRLLSSYFNNFYNISQ